ncbi:hypothetical protein [Lactobacillus amylolyticus]|uniref:hypothetical protein n=1 Tax=Lactobacillus amylolyticus TaxID=83683 RepID=UPI0012DF1181|nr:hypothetical protein [Lactobacillus amylolyticus]
MQFHSKKDQFVYMEIYAHFAMYNAVSLSAASSSKPYSQGKYQYRIDFKMACCVWRRYFSISDNSDKAFTQLLLDMAFYLAPIRPGRKDKRNLKAKLVIGFPYRLAA